MEVFAIILEASSEIIHCKSVDYLMSEVFLREGPKGMSPTCVYLLKLR
jgi:hypothetical protein